LVGLAGRLVVRLAGWGAGWLGGWLAGGGGGWWGYCSRSMQGSVCAGYLPLVLIT
jgi:hypothetical protein